MTMGPSARSVARKRSPSTRWRWATIGAGAIIAGLIGWAIWYASSADQRGLAAWEEIKGQRGASWRGVLEDLGRPDSMQLLDENASWFYDDMRAEPFYESKLLSHLRERDFGFAFRYSYTKETEFIVWFGKTGRIVSAEKRR